MSTVFRVSANFADPNSGALIAQMAGNDETKQLIGSLLINEQLYGFTIEAGNWSGTGETRTVVGLGTASQIGGNTADQINLNLTFTAAPGGKHQRGQVSGTVNVVGVGSVTFTNAPVSGGGTVYIVTA